MAKVDVEPNKLEGAIRRFKRQLEKTGIMNTLRSKQYYEKPACKRKRLKAAAVKRTIKLNRKAEEIRKSSRSKFIKERGIQKT